MAGLRPTPEGRTDFAIRSYRKAARQRKGEVLKDDSREATVVSVCHASKCRERGSPDLARLLDEEVAAHGLEGCVKVRRGGCNDLCSWAPTMAVQPDRIWYAELTPEAAKLVVSQHLSGGKPVRRWVAKDKSAGDGKAGKKTKKAEKRAAKLEK